MLHGIIDLSVVHTSNLPLLIEERLWSELTADAKEIVDESIVTNFYNVGAIRSTILHISIYIIKILYLFIRKKETTHYR